ncbi:MAG: hypothetical protein QXL86_00870 [Candidatus Aenigmatarchaeota archaeon]
MRDYTIRNDRDFGHIPRVNLIDTSVFILASIGNDYCWRIVESQDKSELKFGFVYGVEKQVIGCLINKYNGLGCSWIYNIIKDRNFARLRLELGRIKYRKEHGGLVDNDILTLVRLNEVKCVISLDFSHIIKDYPSNNDKFLTPLDFVEKFDSQLVKLDEAWEKFKKDLEGEKEKLKTQKYKLEDFQDLWIVKYY